MKKAKLLFTFIALSFIFNALHSQVHFVNTTTNDTTSSAIGYQTTATGAMSFASGSMSTASGVCATTMGINNIAAGNYSFTLGSDLKANQNHAIVIGSGYANSIKLENDNTYSLMVGFLSHYPTLFVGTSPTYNKTGKIGIGNVTSPEAKLHLRADEGEEAAMLIEPHNWEGGDTAMLYLGNKENGIAADSQDGMLYNTGNNHVFKGGDVYIEEIDKGIIMKSPDGKCWRGTLDNNGLLGFVRLDACPGQTVAVKEQSDNEDNTLKIYPNPAGDFVTVSIQKREHHLQTIKLLNENGITLVTKNITGNSTRFYTGDLPAGTYIVQVNSGDKRRTGKFLKR